MDCRDFNLVMVWSIQAWSEGVMGIRVLGTYDCDAENNDYS